MIIWICGLSGSGKSTIANEVSRIAARRGHPMVIVDGDTIRQLMEHESSKHAYSLTGRRKNAELIERIVEWLDSQDINVVVAVQSIFQDLLDAHRVLFSSYLEVHLDASLGLVQSRDPKGLHGAALEHGGENVVGYGIPYRRALSSDIYIDMDRDGRSPSEIARDLVTRVFGEDL